MASVVLPYNRSVMTWNGYRQNGGLSGGYSYAAEIMPEEIVANAVSFAINKTPGNNAVVCNGDTIPSSRQMEQAASAHGCRR